MSPVHELLAKLQRQIREAEAKAFDDIERMEAENKQRKDDRWHRMQIETRDLRREATLLIEELANARAYETIASAVIRRMRS